MLFIQTFEANKYIQNINTVLNALAYIHCGDKTGVRLNQPRFGVNTIISLLHIIKHHHDDHTLTGRFPPFSVWCISATLCSNIATTGCEFYFRLIFLNLSHSKI